MRGTRLGQTWDKTSPGSVEAMIRSELVDFADVLTRPKNSGGDQFFVHYRETETQAKETGNKTDSPIEDVEPAGGEMKWQADQKAHRHHPADRADAENDDVGNSESC